MEYMGNHIGVELYITEVCLGGIAWGAALLLCMLIWSSKAFWKYHTVLILIAFLLPLSLALQELEPVRLASPL
jgi:hypothetical protein